MSEVERGLRNISIDNLYEISCALGVELSQFLKR
ncbi:helix-turn-helix domain-containing protein [Alkalihalobacillus deserti]